MRTSKFLLFPNLIQHFPVIREILGTLIDTRGVDNPRGSQDWSIRKHIQVYCYSYISFQLVTICYRFISPFFSTANIGNFHETTK